MRRDEEGGENPRQQSQQQMALLEDARAERGTVVGELRKRRRGVAWRVRESEGELFIAVNG